MNQYRKIPLTFSKIWNEITTGLYFGKTYNKIEIYGGYAHVIDFVFWQGFIKMHRNILNIQIVGGNLAGFDDNQHSNILIAGLTWSWKVDEEYVFLEFLIQSAFKAIFQV